MERFKRLFRLSLVFSVLLVTLVSSTLVAVHASEYGAQEDLEIPAIVVFDSLESEPVYLQDSLLPTSLSINFNFCFLA